MGLGSLGGRSERPCGDPAERQGEDLGTWAQGCGDTELVSTSLDFLLPFILLCIVTSAKGMTMILGLAVSVEDRPQNWVHGSVHCGAESFCTCTTASKAGSVLRGVQLHGGRFGDLRTMREECMQLVGVRGQLTAPQGHQSPLNGYLGQ